MTTSASSELVNRGQLITLSSKYGIFHPMKTFQHRLGWANKYTW